MVKESLKDHVAEVAYGSAFIAHAAIGVCKVLVIETFGKLFAR